MQYVFCILKELQNVLSVQNSVFHVQERYFLFAEIILSGKQYVC
jgi:hypothetical protein